MTDEPLDETDGDEEPEVPEGAAVFPLIPPELGIDPLLLAVLHATVFLAGSTTEVVHTAAADEAVATWASTCTDSRAIAYARSARTWPP